MRPFWTVRRKAKKDLLRRIVQVQIIGNEPLAFLFEQLLDQFIEAAIHLHLAHAFAHFLIQQVPFFTRKQP